MIRRVFTMIMDGVGVGELPDAERYGDSGCNTLGHVAEAAGGLALPHLESIGLSRILPFAGSNPGCTVRGAYGRMAEKSKGKDSTMGHWELAGLITEEPFPLYPQGFPAQVLHDLHQKTGLEFLGNHPASGTEIIQKLGDEHVKSGKPIVYTSGDSVFQIAAHEDVISEHKLYEICMDAREVLTGRHAVSRVIARPFYGSSGDYHRSEGRRDFSLEPPEPTLLDRLLEKGIPVSGLGKVKDLFSGRGFSNHMSSRNNEQGMALFSHMQKTGHAPGFFLVNFCDFDTLWGHRNDASGFAEGLRDFDRWLGDFLAAMQPEDLLLVTADHGNDPTTPGTDHSREYVPVMVTGPSLAGTSDLRTRETFADLAATVTEIFGMAPTRVGQSFWPRLLEMMR